MGQATAFTTKYNNISRRLINAATLIYNGKEMQTKYAQWDTGATSTCISQNVVHSLGLLPISNTIVMTPSGKKILNVYLIDIKLRSNLLIKDVLVIGSEIGAQGVDVLIGMDIINLGDFAVSNYHGETHFSFRYPSQEDVDYVHDIENNREC